MKELKKIFSRLGMNQENGLFISSELRQEGVLSYRSEKLFESRLKPDAFFCIDNKPTVLFYNSPKNRSELFKAIWNFNEAPVVIINEPDMIEILNGLSFLDKENTLEKLADETNLDAFSYFEIVTGRVWQKFGDRFKYNNRVDYKLLENIKAARDLLISQEKVNDYLANALLGKCLFIRYLIDRKVRIKFDDKILRAWSNDEFCQLLEDKTKTIKFLNYLKAHFNGEAFLIEDALLYDIPDSAFEILKKLLLGTEITSNQMSLFDIYDFSIIPVEFISNVYEYFIGRKQQAQKGAYYTPLFLVDYIISETVTKYLKDNPDSYKCKILDPACGSGIFLVESLRKMIERYQETSNNASHNSRNFKEVLKKIPEETIFGIDQDKNAINVAIFSVYLTLLDYQEPKEIENFRFPKLIEKNFFIKDFFNENDVFNNTFQKIDFDFILGNPPWKRGSDKTACFLKYINRRRTLESKISNKVIPSISNKEIAQAFLLRTSDFSSTNTKCALIVTSKTLYNIKADGFREYFLKKYFLTKVFDLSPVRKEVFDKSNDPAVAPAVVLFFNYAQGQSTNKNIINHIALKPNRFFSLFKVFVLQKNDVKQVLQSRLIENDWLWKILLYGSYLDFHLIKRLKTQYESIHKLIQRKKYLCRTGIQYGQDKRNSKHLIGLPIINVNRVKPFFIEPHSQEIFSKSYIHRPRNKELFEGERLIIKKGLNPYFKSTSAIIKEKAIFKDSLTAIKVFESSNIKDLKTCCGLLQSAMFSYFILLTGSSTGVEREQGFNEEKFDFPYTNNPIVSEYVNKIEELCDQLVNKKNKLLDAEVLSIESEKIKLLEKLDEEIFKSFELNEQELALIDYAVKITIPLIMKHKGYEKNTLSPLLKEDPFLKDYSQVYFNRFKKSFENHNKKFVLQILHNEYLVGMFFEIIDAKDFINQVSWKQTSENSIISKLHSLGCQKLTKNLFIQKDIRGFERNGFYIVKPNEKKLWHKAIAHLDVSEFADAMLKKD
jgi:hypothetical protein